MKGHVVWRLDAAKAEEIVVLLGSMIDSGIPQGHHYVDISKPVDMLVLSRNEYPLNVLPPEAVYPPRARSAY
jgi:hypothetical protein